MLPVFGAVDLTMDEYEIRPIAHDLAIKLPAIRPHHRHWLQNLLSFLVNGFIYSRYANPHLRPKYELASDILRKSVHRTVTFYVLDKASEFENVISVCYT